MGRLETNEFYMRVEGIILQHVSRFAIFSALCLSAACPMFDNSLVRMDLTGQHIYVSSYPQDIRFDLYMG